MVCKEDVLTWFKDLDSSQRIDVMCDLLNMCIPFEIRFLGTCIEEIGKHSYQDLRGPTIVANDIDKLSKDVSLVQPQGLLDESIRHRTLICISLLSGRNSLCANWFCKNLLTTNKLEEYILKGRCKDDNVQNEFLLIYMMALHHPAFTFEQKTLFGKIVSELLRQKEGKLRSSPKNSNYYYPPGFGHYPKLPVHAEVPNVPVKTASPIAFADSRPMPKMFPSMMSHPGIDFRSAHLWPPHTFNPAVCQPEPITMPPPPTSPLAEPTAVPVSSRQDSPPPRIYSMRPAANMMHPSAHIADMVTTQQNQMDAVSQSSSLPCFIPDGKIPEEDVNHIPEDKNRDGQWTPNAVMYDIPNGMRFYPKYGMYVVGEHFHNLSLDGCCDNNGGSSLHCSNSSSRSGTPPETPSSTTPSVIPQGPGRGGGGDCKGRMNGIPQTFIASNPPQPLCDTSQPPPPSPYSNCTVPYSNYLPPLTAIPNRFNYTQSRFPFTHSYSYQPQQQPQQQQQVQQQPPPPEGFTSYQYPINSPPIQRATYCYNCGANNHTGAECTGQTIEDITQKPCLLNYNPSVNDMDKT